MTRTVLALGVSLLVAVSSVTWAQQGESTAPTRVDGRAGKAARAAAGALPARPGAGRQQALARQVRQAFTGVVRERLKLNDEQARQLQATERRFTKQRNAVVQSERQARLGLKAAMEDRSGPPDQAKIDQYMHQLVQAQHQRADLLEAEQNEMAGYLTPLQRAQYQALREQLNRRITQLRQNPPKAQKPEP